MAAKKKWVAFRTNATIPKAVLGLDENKKVNAGEPIQVPTEYADHVVHDRFAEFCDAPKRAAPKKSGGPSAEEKAAAELATKSAAAQQRVDDLNAKLAGMSDGDEGWDDLTKELDEAVTELAALKPAD